MLMFKFATKMQQLQRQGLSQKEAAAKLGVTIQPSQLGRIPQRRLPSR